MDEISKIFLPLRSNAVWFENGDSATRLTRTIKAYLIIYDQIHFENGRFHVTIGADGQGMQGVYPPNAVPGGRDKIQYYKPGEEFGVYIGDKQVLKSFSLAAYDVDFYPILKDAELLNYTGIRWFANELKQEIRSQISRKVFEELCNKTYSSVLPENIYLQKHILEGLYQDSIVATLLGMPFSVDHHASPLLETIRTTSQKQLICELPVAFFKAFLSLNVPDFTLWSWEDVIRLRESDAGTSLRKTIHKLSHDVSCALQRGANQSEIDVLIHKSLCHELIEELVARTRTDSGTLASLLLNLIPWGPLPGIINDAMALDKDQSSWVSLLRSAK